MQAIALIARGMWGSAGGARLGWPCAAALVCVSCSAPAGMRDLWGEDIPRDAPVRIWLGQKEIKVLCEHGGAEASGGKQDQCHPPWMSSGHAAVQIPLYFLSAFGGRES